MDYNLKISPIKKLLMFMLGKILKGLLHGFFFLFN